MGTFSSIVSRTWTSCAGGSVSSACGNGISIGDESEISIVQYIPLKRMRGVGKLARLANWLVPSRLRRRTNKELSTPEWQLLPQRVENFYKILYRI